MKFLWILFSFIVFFAVVYLFRRTKRNPQKKEFAFLREIAQRLPGQYAGMLKQAKAGIWKDRAPVGGIPNAYTLIILFANAREEALYYDDQFPHYTVLRNIHAKHRKNSLRVDIELHLNRGLLIQYRSTSPLTELDAASLDCSGMEEQVLHEKAPKSEEAKKVARLFRDASPELLAQLEIDESYDIEIDEGVFYVIKQYDSGDCLTVNPDGAVFLLIHDPYEVRQLCPSPMEFQAAWENGSIDIADEETLMMSGEHTASAISWETLRKYLTDDESSPLYPWVADTISGTVRKQIPYCKVSRDFSIFARRVDMDDCAAMNRAGEVMVYHYQPGNRSFIDIRRKFSSLQEFLEYAKNESKEYKQRT